jgi:hypothetical protein
MKMKHCDMPMPYKSNGSVTSPPSMQLNKPTGGSVADHLQKFLLSQETEATNEPIDVAVREYTDVVEPARLNEQARKPRSTSN